MFANLIGRFTGWCLKLGSDEVYGASVRLKYATLINFFSRLLSNFTSLVFVVFVTRRLSLEEFGTWTMIFKYISYVAPFAVIFTYWLPRTISRGYNTAKTGLALAVTLGSTALIIYIGIAYGASIFFTQPLLPLLLASVIVFQEYLGKCLRSISMAHAPQHVGISRLILRTVQAISGLFLVVLYRWRLYGAVLSVIVGRTCSLILLLTTNYKVIVKSKTSFKVFKNWIKRSWLPLYGSFVTMLFGLDVIVVRSFSESNQPIAYYGVAASLLGLMLSSTQVMPALYARLLAKRDLRDIIEAFWIAYMLNVPMVIGVLVYTEPILAVYNIKYVVASWAVRVFAFAALMRLYTLMLNTVLSGLEFRDFRNEDINLKETVLFKTPSINLIVTLIYLVFLAIASYIFRHTSEIVVLAWGIIYCGRFLSLTILYNRLLRREFSIKLPYSLFLKFILKFGIASLGIIFIRFVFPVEPQISIFPLLKELGPAIVISATLYFGILYVIDIKFRSVVKAIWENVFSIFKH